ncbi:Activated RNA polymerase II transcriptional coactivator p15-like [Homarus americanus]|uniref:Activated RNA polymerase II transcriptional coactivator p15-like n=2 Tax=Homarus americanus TaxID=6706 RepID=A0A8J5JJC7_HOMAM|nr:Activated RNA polymerase II transcriptional coactivator p15-like [Homarus americanus]
MARGKDTARMGKQKNKRPPSDKSESDSDSSSEAKYEPPPKMPKSGASSASLRLTNDNGEGYFQLEGNKRVSIRQFRGKVFVDIREFYEKDGKFLPGKKGISLSPTQWIKLKDLISCVDEEIKELA